MFTYLTPLPIAFRLVHLQLNRSTMPVVELRQSAKIYDKATNDHPFSPFGAVPWSGKQEDSKISPFGAVPWSGKQEDSKIPFYRTNSLPTFMMVTFESNAL